MTTHILPTFCCEKGELLDTQLIVFICPLPSHASSLAKCQTPGRQNRVAPCTEMGLCSGNHEVSCPVSSSKSTIW